MRTRQTDRRGFRIALTALVVGFALLPALAQRGPGGGFEGRGPEARLERLAERLELTDEQQEQLRQAFTAHRESLAPLREQKREAGAALRDAIRAESFDEDAVREAATNVAEIDVELAVARAAHRQQLRGFLSAEQLEQLDRLHERRREMARGPRGRGMKRGPGPGQVDGF
jgi:Spy/CpxP family protein refolding chaperone